MAPAQPMAIGKGSIAFSVCLAIGFILILVGLSTNAMSRIRFELDLTESKTCQLDYLCGWTEGRLCAEGCTDLGLKDECTPNAYSYDKQITVNNVSLVFAILSLLLALVSVGVLAFDLFFKKEAKRKMVVMITAVSCCLCALISFIVFATSSSGESSCTTTDCFIGIGCLADLSFDTAGFSFDGKLNIAGSMYLILGGGIVTLFTGIAAFLKYPGGSVPMAQEYASM